MCLRRRDTEAEAVRTVHGAPRVIIVNTLPRHTHASTKFRQGRIFVESGEVGLGRPESNAGRSAVLYLLDLHHQIEFDPVAPGLQMAYRLMDKNLSQFRFH